MTRLKHYCSIIYALFLSPGLPYTSLAQDKYNWEEISLIDTLSYADFNTKGIQNTRYPPSNLFDGSFKTCWVTKLSSQGNPSLLVKMPANTQSVNLFPGYGKTLNLFHQNSAPKKLRLSIYAAINPDGYVSEVGSLYKASRFPKDTLVALGNTFGLQTIGLWFSQQELDNFYDEAKTNYGSSFSMPMASSCLILQLEILEERPGTKYDDLCISELFFNNRYVSPGELSKTDQFYISEDEHVLIVENKANEKFEVFRDTTSVLQIAEISANKKWAIVLSMSSDAQDRAEVGYLLIDLLNKEVVNSKLEKIDKYYLSGIPIFFETGENNETYLEFNSLNGETQQIELI